MTDRVGSTTIGAVSEESEAGARGGDEVELERLRVRQAELELERERLSVGLERERLSTRRAIAVNLTDKIHWIPPSAALAFSSWALAGESTGLDFNLYANVSLSVLLPLGAIKVYRDGKEIRRLRQREKKLEAENYALRKRLEPGTEASQPKLTGSQENAALESGKVSRDPSGGGDKEQSID